MSEQNKEPEIPKQTETEKKIQWQYKGNSARVPLYRSPNKNK